MKDLLVEEQSVSETVLLPFRDACALLKEAVREARPEGTSITLTQSTEDSLRITVFHQHLRRICTLSVEYLTQNRSRRIFRFPCNFLAEWANSERDKVEVREFLAQHRQIREALIDGVRAHWDALLAPPLQDDTQPRGGARVGRRGRKATPEPERRKIVEGWRSLEGTMTQEAYCDRVAVGTSTLRKWIREFEAKGE